MNNECGIAIQSSKSWIDLQKATPKNILDIVANSSLGGTVGSYANSSNFANPGTWVTSPFVIASNPTASALGTDNIQKVADASQWNFQHLTASLSAATPLPLQKIIFLRGGTEWQNTIVINFGGSTYTEVQLGYLENAATRGDKQGTYPVVSWTGSFTGTVSLTVTFKHSGRYNVGLWAKSGSNYSMFEMQWVVVGIESSTLPDISNLNLSSLLTNRLSGLTNGQIGLGGLDLTGDPAPKTELFTVTLGLSIFTKLPCLIAAISVGLLELTDDGGGGNHPYTTGATGRGGCPCCDG